MWLIWIFAIDQNIIQIHNNKDIEIFSKNLVNIPLKTGQSIKKPKKYNLVFEIAIPDLENNLLLIIFLNSYSIISIDLVQLGKTFSLI